jgi:hypothetical protein
MQKNLRQCGQLISDETLVYDNVIVLVSMSKFTPNPVCRLYIKCSSSKQITYDCSEVFRIVILYLWRGGNKIITKTYNGYLYRSDM